MTRINRTLLVCMIAALVILAAGKILPPRHACADNSVSLPAISPKQAGLTDAQMKVLRSLDIPIVAPAYVPKDFTILMVQAEYWKPGYLGGPSYAIVYQGPADKMFVIEASPSSAGDFQAHKLEPIEVPLFGKGHIAITKSPFNGQDTYMTHWFKGKNTYYMVLGADLHHRTRDAKNISMEEAKKVIRSLRYIQE